MSGTIDDKKDKKVFQTTLTQYITTKSTNQLKVTSKEQVKQLPQTNKQGENDEHTQQKIRIIITKQQRTPSNKSHTDQLLPISARSRSPSPILQKKQPPMNLNVRFYHNKMPSEPNGEYIDLMHEKWAKNYEKLERDHSFIQWIFPNSFQSRFNIHARPLSSTEAEQFRTNTSIIDRYLKSYEMMLGFYGLRLKDRSTGELMRSRNPDFKQRMHKTLLTSFHNHMRITRICCSLTETGFGKYASELCKILKFQIYDKQGFLNSLQRYNVYKDWAPFEFYDQAKGLKSVYFQKIHKKKQGLKQNERKEQNSANLEQGGEKPETLKQEDERLTIKVLIDKKSNI